MSRDIDKLFDKQTDDWLKQQVAAGRLSQEEYEAVSLDRESSGCTRPEWKKWDKTTVPYWLGRDCEIYINYPAWTQQEIADRLGITEQSVRRALGRVRRMYPSLGNDPGGYQGLPSLKDMRPLDSGSYEDVSEDEHKF